MSESQTPNGSENSKETCATLQHQLNSVLILTCVVSLTLTIFFFLNFRALQGEVKALRPVVADYQTKTQPALQDLNLKLVEYAKTHPDIQPLLTKYGVGIPTNAPVAAPKK
jgi:hypothetical protein